MSSYRPVSGAPYGRPPRGTSARRHARARARQIRRRRTITVLLAVAVLALVLVVALNRHSGPGSPPATSSASARTAGVRTAAAHGSPTATRTTSGSPILPKGATPAIESGVESWFLPAAVSRAVAYAAPAGGQIVLAGGLTASSSSTAAVTDVSVPGGAVSQVGTLTTAGHDAAGAVLGDHFFVFGGGDQTSVDTVQSLPLAGTGQTATMVGHLPQPRSDDTAAVIGRTAYVIGGYNGTTADPQVLATSNGRSFRVICNLPVPVRYATAAVVGGTIYVFGGQTVGKGASGQAVNDIQAINPANGSASVVGHLAQPLAGAAAVNLGGHVYVAGGDTSLTGGTGGAPITSNAIWAFDPTRHTVGNAGTLQVPVSHAAVAITGGRAWLLGGETAGTPGASVQMLEPNAAFGVAGKPGAGSPYYGDHLLVADRGNNRLLLLNDASHIVWEYPNATAPPPPGAGGFYFPDDAFFIDHGKAIISNQEENETIVEIAYPSGKMIWRYGHPGQVGSAPGYLSEPDDAYLLKNGQISVADAYNCRILIINPNGTVAHQIGTTGVCQHNPPTSMGTPNGDTPLADGNLLVSEINGSWVSEYTPTGQLVWTVQLPISYPSDPQQLGPDLYLISDYHDPGAILEFNRAGQILYRYQPTSGPGMLNQPSLTERLPSGVFMTNDDYNDRMVSIDPATGAVVWQYGVTGQAGTSPGMLNTPDGFDVITPQGTTPTHPYTG